MSFFDRRRCFRSNAQQTPALLQSFVPVTVGQEAVIADADKTARKRVHQEAADELTAGEGQDLALLSVGIILVTKTHSAISQFDQSPVRDGDAMRVAGQIFQNTSR